jgi:hypothetical protein
MRSNEKHIGDDRPESAQGGDETELAKFLSKIQIKFDAAKMFLSMLRKDSALRGQFDCAENEENNDNGNETDHNSLP